MNRAPDMSQRWAYHDLSGEECSVGVLGHEDGAVWHCRQCVCCGKRILYDDRWSPCPVREEG